MTHEDFHRKEEIKQSSERSFGLVVAAFFVFVTFWPLVHDRPVRWWALGIAAVFTVLALLWAPALAPFNVLWAKLGLLLHRIVSPVILGLLFYGTITPVAALMRLLGKDPLKLRRERDATTYWISRSPPGPPPETMKNQF
jgi:hypothetical protein